jgi:hypothetical protein
MGQQVVYCEIANLPSNTRSIKNDSNKHSSTSHCEMVLFRYSTCDIFGLPYFKHHSG